MLKTQVIVDPRPLSASDKLQHIVKALFPGSYKTQCARFSKDATVLDIVMGEFSEQEIREKMATYFSIEETLPIDLPMYRFFTFIDEFVGWPSKP